MLTITTNATGSAGHSLFVDGVLRASLAPGSIRSGKAPGSAGSEVQVRCASG